MSRKRKGKLEQTPQGLSLGEMKLPSYLMFSF